MAKKVEDKITDIVAPVESIETEPVQEETSDGPVLKEEVVDKPTSEECWNCKNNVKVSHLKNGVCDECGFDKGTLYNLDLEAEKSAERQRQAQAQAQVVLAAQITQAK